MNLHEYQAKKILKGHGVAVPAGKVTFTAEEAAAAVADLGGGTWVIKAQIHAGGRGKAGGVRRAGSAEEARAVAADLLGTTLVTEQTGAGGKAVKRLYVEEAVEIARELYLAALVDRSLGRVALLASQEGGEDIEAAARVPGKLIKLPIDPAEGLTPEEAAGLAAGLGLEGAQAEALADIAAALYRAFLDHDASLIEINPLGVTTSGEVVALDVKMILDDNALFRHEALEALRDADEQDPSELDARRYELNYVKLDGDIGCMVNGAGLALATLDLITESGGAPAAFMDVRPVASRDQVAGGFKILLANPGVKAILVNVYGGGILRCDTIAEGIATAVREVGLGATLIFRAAGTNCEIARKILQDRQIAASFPHDLAEAVRQAVAAAKREAA